MHNLKYIFTSKLQRLYLFILKIIVPYLHQKFTDYSVSSNWGDRNNLKGNLKLKLKFLADFILRFTLKLSQASQLINFLFLIYGHSYVKRSLVETLL
jgi:hypothetical protein